MADPTTAGGGTEGLRDELCAFLWLEEHPGTMTWPEIVVMAAQHPQCMGALRAEAIRDRVDKMLAGPLARASAEQARVEAERADERTRRLMAERAAERWMRGCRAAEAQAAGLGDNLNALAGMYGEACGNFAKARWERRRCDLRIRAQRAALRETWEIVEARVGMAAHHRLWVYARGRAKACRAAESRVASLTAERDRLKAALVALSRVVDEGRLKADAPARAAFDLALNPPEAPDAP